MAYSQLYHNLLDGAFFIDPRRVDARAVLIDKLLRHDTAGFTQKTLSEETAMPHAFVAAGDVSARRSGSYADAPEGSAAVINLHGDMLKYGTMCSYGTTEIADQMGEAAASPKIAGIVLDIDSGGGAVDAISPLQQAIAQARAAGKPVVALCDLCASAAYYVALSCNEILAANELSAEFGSIGVMMSFADYAKYYEQNGVKIHTVYSDLSTYKNAPFEAARQGKYELVRSEQLNPLAAQFQQAVRDARHSLDEKVEGILQGRTFYAREALKHGLIDGIGGMSLAVERISQLRADACLADYASRMA